MKNREANLPRIMSQSSLCLAGLKLIVDQTFTV